MSKPIKSNKFPFLVTNCLGNLFRRINISRQRVWENHQSETVSLIRRQVICRNYFKQMSEKQNGVKTCTRSLKKKTTPMCGNRCSFVRKRKGCPYKTGMKRLKSYKSSNILLWKITLLNFSSASTRFFQPPTYPTIGEFSQQYLSKIRIQCSTCFEIE